MMGREGAPRPSATVITPSMNAQNIASLLGSLATQTAECEVLVVDNGSAGETVSQACHEFAFARPLRLAQNAGFSRAVNLAAREAQGDALVLVNDDSVCEPAFVEEITNALARSGGAMAAGVMREARRPELIETAGIEIDRNLLAFDYLNGLPLSALDGEVPDPLGPSGAAAAYRTDAFLAAGGFDERIFAYWEDVDLALRLAATGSGCALAPRALGTHAHSSTLGSGSSRKNYLMGFGRGYVLRKWGGTSLRTIPAILLRDLPICAGQVVFDRNAAGIRGRVAGLRAQVDPNPYPADLIAASPGSGPFAALRRRLSRRRRLRR